LAVAGQRPAQILLPACFGLRLRLVFSTDLD